MGHGFGGLWKYRGIITYRLSPFELRAFGGALVPGLGNVLTRILSNVPYVVPPLGLAYIVYDQVEKEHAHLMRKNPADFENDK
ncbi:cytochrome b-c1 complex subunit 8 [Euwallacea similis]|uniref:cytochrome b-c1 complex subunit 8 n=1 Tax=Euwallacea similis TaxID=1736056 RepID=UPI00344C82AC